MDNEVYKENYELKKKIEQLQDDFDDIIGILVSIGAPLNDNVLGYTNKQLEPFRKIYDIVKYGGSDD